MRSSVHQASYLQSAWRLHKTAGRIGSDNNARLTSRCSCATQSLVIRQRICLRSAAAASLVGIQVQVLQFCTKRDEADPNPTARRCDGEDNTCNTGFHAELDKLGCGWRSQRLSSQKINIFAPVIVFRPLVACPEPVTVPIRLPPYTEPQ